MPAVLQRGFVRAAGRLTESHRRLAEFMARSYQDVAFLSAAQVGRRTGVSPATVVRFARILGFKGYPELQGRLQAAMKDEVRRLQRLHKTAAGTAAERWALAKVVETDILNLQETLLRSAEKTFREAVGLLTAAPAVHVVVGISFRSHTRETLEILGTLGRARPRLIVITDSPVFPLAGEMGVMLNIATEHPSFLESSVPALALIKALISAVASTGRPATLPRLRRHQELWESLRTY